MKNIFCILLICCSYGLRAQNLAACYDFDGGNAIDNVTGNVGIVNRCSNVADRFGRPNKAIYASCAMGGLINLGSGANLKPMNGTISLWVYKPNVCRNGGIEPLIDVEQSNGTTSAGKTYGIGYAFDLLQAIGSTTNTSYFSNEPVTMPLNSWHHLVLTFDDTCNVFYQDGVQSYRLSILAPISYSPGANVLLGWAQRNFASTDTYFDDLRIYDGAMSAAQVAALYQNTSACGAVGVPTVAGAQGAQPSVYPNPTHGLLNIAHPDGLGFQEASVFDVSGRRVLGASMLQGRAELSLSGLAQGVYFLLLTDEEGKVSRHKVMVNH